MSTPRLSWHIVGFWRLNREPVQPTLIPDDPGRADVSATPEARARRERLTLREARFDEEDLKGVWDLLRTQFPAYRACTLPQFMRLYEQLWLDNPARSAIHVFGWVLQSNGAGIVGFIGLLPIRIKVGDSEIVGGAGHSWVVQPAHRSHSLRLYKQLMAWADAHMLLFTTSLEQAARINALFGCRQIPVEQFTRQAFWLFKPESVAKVALDKMGWQRLARWSDRFPLNLAVRAVLRARFARHAWGRLRCNPMQMESPSEFGAAFDRLWDDNKRDYPVTTVRDNAFLTWRHFRLPSPLGRTQVFACRDGARLCGYVAVQVRRNEADPLTGHFTVTDLFYERSHPDALNNLLNAVFDFARSNACAVLEISDVSADIMHAVQPLRPYMRNARPWTYWYKAPTTALSEHCASQPWWPAGIDGDINI